MQRRGFLKSGAAVVFTAAAQPALRSLDTSIPVIDSHIHLFDPTRSGGVPWPEKTDSVLYRPSLPSRYAHLAEPHHVVGAIAVECSSWLVDNFWLMDVVERNLIMLGFIGDLVPGAPDFAATLDRLHRSPLFLGIRYGNLWDRDLGRDSAKPGFVSGLQLLAEAGLVLETANPDASLIAAVVKVTDRVPNLRIVLDHLPHAQVPSEPATRAAYDSNLRELARRPSVFVKGSEIVKRIDGRTSLDPVAYKDALDQLWELFGEDRLFFGSDWPNSDSLASYDETFGVAQRYIDTRSAAAQRKFFWKNSISVYNWRPRSAAQTQLQRS
jgi:predicted TIM-barrel fold metal-dependent hydrolase